jgi:hypothetical protein
VSGSEKSSESPRLKFGQHRRWYIFKPLILVHFMTVDNRGFLKTQPKPNPNRKNWKKKEV